MSRISRLRRARRYRPSVPAPATVIPFKPRPRPLVEIDQDLSWFVIWTGPRGERRVEEKLCKRELAAYVPREAVSTSVRGREVEVERPAVSRYVFVGLETDAQWSLVHLALRDQGSWFGAKVLGRVLRAADGAPLEVPASVLQWFADGLCPVAEGNDTSRVDFAAGGAVRAVSGHLAGFVGIVESSDDLRVRALLDILGRQTLVEFDRNQLEAA